MSAKKKYNAHLMDTVYTTFGTLDEFAKAMSISRWTAYNIARDPNRMTLDFVRRLAKKTNKTVCEIIPDNA